MDEYDPIPDIAALISGLSVPISIGVPLGTAREPWVRLYDNLAGIGYPSPEQLEDTLRKRLSRCAGT